MAYKRKKYTPALQRVYDTDNPLRMLLMEVCVPNSNGIRSMSVLAANLEVSSETTHRWCRELYMPLWRANDILGQYNAFRDKEMMNAELVGEECPLREVSILEFVPFATDNSKTASKKR